jgi:hypothetical protein
MADANQAAEDLARAMAQVNEELARLGKVTQQTQNDLTDANVKAKYGIENYTKGTAQAAEGVMALGRGAAAAGRAMLDGKKGAAAFNSSLDELSTAATAAGAALALMVPGGFIIKGLIAGLTLATGALIKYAKEANIMADQLYKGYTGLAKAGGAAADGMTGLYRDAQKLGLAMTELDQMVSLVAENSKDFALFAGSVSDGRKKFADMGAAMEPTRQSLLNMGLEVKDINEGMAGYVRIQTRLGNAQKMSVDQLANGAREYLKEQDMLTKLTGQSRSEMEQQRERALQKEQFAAKVRELQLSGQKEAAESLLKLNSIYEAAGPEMASAFQASVTGNLSNKDAQKANLASQGEMIRSTQQVIDGQITFQEAAQRTGKAIGHTADTVGTTLGQLGAYNENFGNLAEQLKLAQMAEGDIVANSKKIQEDQKAQMAAADPLVKNQTAIVEAQIAANKAVSDFVFKGIEPAQKAMEKLARLTEAGAKALDQLTPGGSKLTQKTVEGAAETAGALGAGLYGGLKGAAMGAMFGPIGAAVGAVIGSAAGVWLGGSAGKKVGEIGAEAAGLPKGAEGGMFSGPTSGYLAMLHGTELVIPQDQLKGKVSAGSMSGVGGEQMDEMNNLYKEMIQANTQANQELGKINESYKGMFQANTQANEQLDAMNNLYQEMFKDTQALEKLTDSDLKKTQNFSRLSDRVRTLKTSLIEDEIDLLEEQNDLLEKMVEIAEKAGGKDAAAAMKKQFTLSRMNMGNMPSMGGGMGGGTSMPSASGSNLSQPGGTGLRSGGKPAVSGMGGGSGLTSTSTEGGQGLKGSPNDLLQFGGASGSASAFAGLDDRLEKAVLNAASEYNSLTGKKLKINSAKRDPNDQVRLYQETVDAGRPGVGPTGMPVGRPGTSSHEKGLAVDIQNYNDPDALSALNRQGLRQVIPKDPVHFTLSAETGMIADGPETGYQATLHGKEAVIPMQNNSGDFVKMFASMAESSARMVDMMEQMVSAQKNSVDVQTKMLRAQS